MTAEEVKARGYNLDIKNPHTVADDHGDPEELLASLNAAEAETAQLARPVEGDPGGGAGAMNAERLLAHYERIADAPDAIARLRRFVLDLAVRGKLVPQDPNDEPASELLKRIAKEKARLVKAGEIRNPEADPAVCGPAIPDSRQLALVADRRDRRIEPTKRSRPTTCKRPFVPMPLIAAEYGAAQRA